MRFVKEYKNYQVKQIEANDLMNEGIKAEILSRIERGYKLYEQGYMTTDEIMQALSSRFMEDGEDMSRYYTEAKSEAAKQTEAEQTASRVCEALNRQ